MSARAAETGKAGSLMWAQGLACGGILAFAPAIGLLMAALLWPVVIAFLRDKTPGKPLVRAVGLCAAAGAAAPLRAAWGQGAGASLALATDLHVLAVAWGAAAAGWGLSEAAPLAVRALMEANAATRAARLRAEQARLRAAFGWTESGADL